MVRNSKKCKQHWRSNSLTEQFKVMESKVNLIVIITPAPNFFHFSACCKLFLRRLNPFAARVIFRLFKGRPNYYYYYFFFFLKMQLILKN